VTAGFQEARRTFDPKSLEMASNRDFWSGKRVFLTGFTGFKGAWAWILLEQMGAEVSGLSYAPETVPNLSATLGIANRPGAHIGDIRDPVAMARALEEAQPEFVIHMAAQALVRRSYREAIETFDVNVRGTLTLLEALRKVPSLKACLVITSDKVYENNDLGRRFTEDDPLGGSDPYSASKAACEIATSSFARSYFEGKQLGSSKAAVATARAGNVIGGGDWSEDRIVPDLWRARQSNSQVELRFPESTRPWQHVLEPIMGYLMFLRALSEGLKDRALNFGPIDDSIVTVREVVETFQLAYGKGAPVGWRLSPGEHAKEAKLLAIDASQAVNKLGWLPRLTPHEAIAWTAQWYAAFDRGEDMVDFTRRQIAAYEKLVEQTRVLTFV
jgi:CDP-glucose 4,6-dehydratase